MTYVRFVFAAFSLIIGTSVASIADYRIQPGDRLLIAVIGEAEYNQSVTVREDGKISYFGGDLPVVGKTPEEVRQQVRDILQGQGQLKNPILMVSPIPREGEIFVGGAVKAPGRYPLLLQDEIGLYRAIALAGGLSELADVKGVQVVRQVEHSRNGVEDSRNGDETVERYDLSPSEPYRPILVKRGDLVIVPALGQVEVRGQVHTEGKIPIRGRIRIDHALARAGGPVYDEADLSALVVVRASGEKIEVKVSEQFWRDVQDGSPEPAKDHYYLYDGDVLYLPDAYRIEKVYILGYIQNPGPQKVRGAVTPMQAIALAGGTKEEANLKKARIMRKDGTIQEVSLRRYNDRRTNEAGVLLYGGDTLEISKRFQMNWSLILSLISVTSVAVGIIRR